MRSRSTSDRGGRIWPRGGALCARPDRCRRRGAQLRRRLEQGVLPREILEAEFKDLIVKVSDNEPIDIAAAPGWRQSAARARKTPTISIWP